MVLGTGNLILAGAPITVLWKDDCYDDEGKTVDAREGVNVQWSWPGELGI